LRSPHDGKAIATSCLKLHFQKLAATTPGNASKTTLRYSTAAKRHGKQAEFIGGCRIRFLVTDSTTQRTGAHR
jgi:hypothetical protein